MPGLLRGSRWSRHVSFPVDFTQDRPNKTRLAGSQFSTANFLAQEVRLAKDLNVAGIADGGQGGEPWEPGQLSQGERHQVALAVKIAVARALTEMNGPVFLILDDSLVSFDPKRRAQTEALLLDLVADGKLQVILLTCHTDWVADWRLRSGEAFGQIEREKTVEYYTPPAGVSEV